MRSFAPCLVVILAGLALGVAGAFAWITGDAYEGEHARGLPGPALVGIKEPSIEPAAINFPAAWLGNAATPGTLSRGGKAT